jgi:hypothetical protein
VCKTFFLATLAISKDAVYTAIAKKNVARGFTGEDLRGRHTPANKYPDDSIAAVQQHIHSFPVIESHYCRKGSQRKYLDAKLTIIKMYELYKIWMVEHNITAKLVSQSKYREVFGTCFNLSFFRPQKDQCKECNLAADNKDNEVIQMAHAHHIKMKDAAQKVKKDDKTRSETQLILNRQLSICNPCCRYRNQMSVCYITNERFACTTVHFIQDLIKMTICVIRGQKLMENVGQMKPLPVLSIT